MAIKIELVGNYIIMTDTITGETIFERSAADIHYIDNNRKIYLFYGEGFCTPLGEKDGYKLSDFVNSAGNTFANYDALILFLRENTGFNTASGGSEATTTVTHAIKSVEPGGILKGQPVAFSGWNDGENAIEVVLADNSTGVAIGLATSDLAFGDFGEYITTGILENFDTTAWAEGNILYVNGAGILTETEPTTGFAQPIAFVLRSHANNGDVQVNADYPKQDASDVRVTPLSILKEAKLQDNLSIINDSLDFNNGSFKESFDALVVSDGVTINMTLEQQGGGDLTMRLSDGETIFDCTPLQTIELTAGLDTVPQRNYIYILKSTKVLTKSLTGFPTDEHIKVGFFFVQSATFVNTANRGALINQNHNDHAMNGNKMGHMVHMAEAIRKGTGYDEGIDGNGTDNYIQLVTNVGVPDNLYIKTTSGFAYQLHKHGVPAKDTSGTDVIHIVNDSVTNYKVVSDLSGELLDSLGVSLSGKYYNVTIGIVANKTGEYTPLMLNLPSGSYSNQTDAINDVNGYDNLSAPREFTKESTTGVFIVRITLKHSTASGGTWTIISTKDLRDSSRGGGSTAPTAITEFADSQLRVYNVLDITKEVSIDASNVGTGQERKLIAPDYDVELGLLHHKATVGENVVLGDTLYLKSDGKYWKTDAVAEATSTSEIVIATETILTDAQGILATKQTIGGFIGLTIGDIYYLNEGGGITNDVSGFASGSIVRIIGTGYTATTIRFNPDSTWIKLL